MTILPKQILVPTDFSEPAKTALAWAAGLCDGCSASLHLLHVLETLTVTDPLDVTIEARRRIADAIEATARNDLRHLLSDENRARLHVTLAVEWGSPLVEIVRYASAHGIGLIAIGTHGRGRIERKWLGSVAAHIVRSAPCGVLVVRPLTGIVRQGGAKLIDQ
jgi:nucleotide-binding universal stress UspA family protein